MYERPPLPKRLKRFVRYLLVRAAAGVASVFPVRWMSGLAGLLGRLGFVLAIGERRKALRHLALAFPERTEAERRRIAQDSFVHLARCVAELVCVRQIDAELERWIELPTEARALLERALAGGKGVVFVSGHIGNWEFTARGISARGYPCATIAREASDPRTTAFIERLRASGRLTSIWRGHPGAAKAMLRQLRSGGILGLLIDQDTKVQSVFVPFFGHPASTPRAAADLVLRTGAALIVGTCPRVAPHHYRIALEAVPLPEVHDEAAVVQLTAALTAKLEHAIRQYPEQWVWMHERWKRQPEPIGSTTEPVAPARA